MKANKSRDIHIHVYIFRRYIDSYNSLSKFSLLYETFQLQYSNSSATVLIQLPSHRPHQFYFVLGV